MAYRDPRLAYEAQLRELRRERDELDAHIARVELVIGVERSRAFRERLRRLTFIGLRISLLGIVGGMILSALLLLTIRHRRPARVRATRTDAQSIRWAATMYRSENAGACPLLSDLTDGGYLDASHRIVDAWDRPFLLHCDGEDVRVVSAGRDETWGTDDDLE